MYRYIQLDPQSIRKQILGLGLKHYWVAEQAGIHPTTFRRWLSGKIRKVREENALSLARILETSVEEIGRFQLKKPTHRRRTCQPDLPRLA